MRVWRIRLAGVRAMDCSIEPDNRKAAAFAGNERRFSGQRVTARAIMLLPLDDRLQLADILLIDCALVMSILELDFER